MKKLLIYIFVMMISVSVLFAQNDTTNVNKKSEQKSSQTQLKGFVDKDGDGIDDRIANRQNKTDCNGTRQRKHDKFIDKDGDGINDNRCNGFGIYNQQGSGKGKQKGKNGGKK